MIEVQVINYLLQTKDASFITLNNLDASYFSTYPDEYNFIMNHYKQYGSIPDQATFFNKFDNFDAVEVHENQKYLLTELYSEKKRKLVAQCINKGKSFYNNDDLDEAIRLIEQTAELSKQCVSLEAVDLIANTTRYERYEDKINNYDKYFIKTGFKELDVIIGGWDVNEDLVTIVARNGLGKSWILLKCAAAAALQGKTVGIYSGEMSEDAVGYRLDTIIGGVANGALVHGSGSVKYQYKEFLERLQELVPGKIWALTPQMINGPATVSALRTFIDKYNLDILCVDQHSLLEDERGAKSPTEKASNISKDLKLLQSVKRIPIIAVSQQNRETKDDGTFDTTQIAQADRIGQDSSVVIFIERKDELMKLHLVKSRQSGCGNVLTYHVDLNRGIFDYIPEGNEKIEQAVETEDLGADVF